jgi:hypothetical protein
MLLFQNLGALPALNPAMRANVILPGRAPAASTGKAPGVGLEQWHYRRLFEDVFGPPNQTAEQAKAAADYVRARGAALATGLPNCPVESVDKERHGYQTCYGATVTPVVGGWKPNEPLGLLLPGTFSMYGALFTPDDLKDGRFTKTVVPDEVGRRAAEWALILGSLRYLHGGSVENSLSNPNTRQLVGGTDGKILQGLRAKYAPSASKGAIADMARKLSVQQVLDAVPDMTLFGVNLRRNPIQPTPAQRTGEGGWAAWLAAGGYPLSRSVLSGKKALGNGVVIRFCAGLLCRCPTSGQPACVPEVFNKKGVGPDYEGISWFPFIGLSPDVGNPAITVTLVYDDPTWIQKYGTKLGRAIFDTVGNLLCGNPSATQTQLQTLAAELCVTSTGQPCTKGTPGCVCTKPPATTQASIDAAGTITAAWCSTWRKDQQPRVYPPVVPPPPPQLPPPPPPPPRKNEGMGLSPLQLGGLAVAGVLAGVLIARRRA